MIGIGVVESKQVGSIFTSINKNAIVIGVTFEVVILPNTVILKIVGDVTD